MNNPSFIFINGKGSSGKDTQADLLLQKIGDTAIRLSTGDIYRDAKNDTGEFARYHSVLAPYIENVDTGGYIPDEVIVDIVKEVLSEKLSEGKETFIFTGFPRTIPQLVLVDEMVRSLGASSIYLMFDVSDETSRERAAIRYDKCIKQGISPRPEDVPDVVENRLDTYRKKTYPMLLKLDRENRLVKINAEGTIPEIESETRSKLFKERL